MAGTWYIPSLCLPSISDSCTQDTYAALNNKSYPHNRQWRPIGLWTLRIPQCIDNWPIHCGNVASPTHWHCSVPQKHYSTSGTHFCYRPSKPQGLVRLERLGKLRSFIDQIRFWTRNLLVCSILPQPLHYCMLPLNNTPMICRVYHIAICQDTHNIYSISRSYPQEHTHLAAQDKDDIQYS
jgi:hypothetical protein